MPRLRVCNAVDMPIFQNGIAKVSTVSDFMRAISELPSPKERTRFFRGHADHKHFRMFPGIYRNASFEKNEAQLIHEAIIRCPADFPSSLNFFEKLVRLQHYGLPTRLLDLTSNALVALYFTCCDREKTAGEVLVLDIPTADIKYYDGDTAAVIANIARRDANFTVEGLPNDLKSFNEEEDIDRMVHDIRDDKPAFRHCIVKSDLKRVICVRAKLDNARIARQDGAFLLFGIGTQKRFCAKVPEPWIVCGNLNRKIIVTSKYKIRHELEQFGVSEQTLFPELDHQTESIKQKFMGKYKRKPKKVTIKRAARISTKKRGGV